MLFDFVKLGEFEKFIYGNEDVNVRCYFVRDYVRLKYFDDYVIGEDIDDVVDDIVNCIIDFCYRLVNVF